MLEVKNLHATIAGKEILKGKDSPCSKKIVQLDLKGNYIKTWGSLSDASNELKICRSEICSTCKRKIYAVLYDVFQ